MKLGLKEIGAVAALATAGCAMDKPTTAISRRQYVDFPDTITEKMVSAVRARCAQIGRDEKGRVFDNFAWWGGPLELMQDTSNRAEEEARRICLTQNGLAE